MSALAHGIKDKMFGFLKNWLPRPIENQPESQPLLRAASPASLTPTCNSPGLGHVAASAVTVSEVELPLASLLPHVPSELRSRVRSNVSAASVRIPMETVLPQLASGAVKITFGELRQLAPELFYSGGDRDHVPVPLPLAEVL